MIRFEPFYNDLLRTYPWGRTVIMSPAAQAVHLRYIRSTNPVIPKRETQMNCKLCNSKQTHRYCDDCLNTLNGK